jgi:hypothetical protein
MKRITIISIIVALLAFISWQRYQINRMGQELGQLEQERERQSVDARNAALKQLQRFPSDHRKTECASHIGRLKGARHEAALIRFHALFDDNYFMTEGELKACQEF